MHTYNQVRTKWQHLKTKTKAARDKAKWHTGSGSPPTYTSTQIAIFTALHEKESGTLDGIPGGCESMVLEKVFLFLVVSVHVVLHVRCELCSRMFTFHVQDTSAVANMSSTSLSTNAMPSKVPADAQKKLFTFKPPTASVRKAAATATVTSAEVCETTYQDFAEELSGL